MQSSLHFCKNEPRGTPRYWGPHRPPCFLRTSPLLGQHLGSASELLSLDTWSPPPTLPGERARGHLPQAGAPSCPSRTPAREVLSACLSPAWAFAPAQPSPALFPLRVSWAPGGRTAAIRTGQGGGFGKGRPATSSRTRSHVTFPRQPSPNSCPDNKRQERLLKKIVCQDDLGKRCLPPALRDTPGHTGETPATQTPHEATPRPPA